jgi:hypothetical protein
VRSGVLRAGALTKARAQVGAALAPLPADVPCHEGVEVFSVSEQDERAALRGQARRRQGFLNLRAR